MHICKMILDFYFLLHPLPPHHLSPRITLVNMVAMPQSWSWPSPVEPPRVAVSPAFAWHGQCSRRLLLVMWPYAGRTVAGATPLLPSLPLFPLSPTCLPPWVQGRGVADSGGAITRPARARTTSHDGARGPGQPPMAWGGWAHDGQVASHRWLVAREARLASQLAPMRKAAGLPGHSSGSAGRWCLLTAVA
jgi:hypothetical protein